MFEATGTSLILVCPRGKPTDTGDVKIDITTIKRLESRIQEVAFVNAHKAPELLATFNSVCLDLGEYVTMLESEKISAERALGKRRAIMLTDTIVAILESKNLKDSKDNRDAILALDPEMETLQDRLDKIKIAIAFLKTKYDGFEMAYQSVKKLVGENNYNHRNPNLSGQIGDAPLGSTTKATGYGQAKY